MILSKKSYQPQKLSVNTFTTGESDEVELLGLTIYKDLILASTLTSYVIMLNINFMLYANKKISKLRKNKNVE